MQFSLLVLSLRLLLLLHGAGGSSSKSAPVTAPALGKCISGNCHNGRGTWEHRSRAGDETYDGSWKGGLRDGYGVQTYNDGSHYAGEWEHGKRHGQGIFMGAVAMDSYDGAWADDERHGKGTAFRSDGEHHGEWTRGVGDFDRGRAEL